jgi:hypothetical protein
MEAWKHAADNLLAHFRTISKGNVPFTVDWKDEGTQRAANLDQQSIEYLEGMQTLIESHLPDLQSTSRMSPETPLVWISKLFLPPE